MRRYNVLADRKNGQQWPNNNTNNEARWLDDNDDNNDWLTNWGSLLDDDNPHLQLIKRLRYMDANN